MIVPSPEPIRFRLHDFRERIDWNVSKAPVRRLLWLDVSSINRWKCQGARCTVRVRLTWHLYYPHKAGALPGIDARRRLPTVQPRLVFERSVCWVLSRCSTGALACLDDWKFVNALTVISSWLELWKLPWQMYLHVSWRVFIVEGN